MSITDDLQNNGHALVVEAGTRALQRVNLADGNLQAAFDAQGNGTTVAAMEFVLEGTPQLSMIQRVLLGAMTAVEADRENRRRLLHAERAHIAADRRQRKDVAPGQLALDGIEPARHVPSQELWHWQKLRVAVWVRANGCCEDCGRKGKRIALDMHHVSYDRYGLEEPTDIMLLCRDCHDRRHTEPPV